MIEGPNRREVTLDNTNDLLDGDAIHGVKTGTTGEAGACLILAKWERGTNQVVTVVLGSEITYDLEGFVAEDKRWDDTNAVLRAVEQDVRWVLPSDPDDVPGCATRWRPGRSCSRTRPRSCPNRSRVVATLFAPTRPGRETECPGWPRAILRRL